MDSLPTPILLGFPSSSDDKASICNARDLGSVSGWGRSPGSGNDNPLQYSCLENPVDRGAWRVTVHGVEKSWTRRSKKTHTRNVGDLGLTPGLGRSPGGGYDNPLRYSCLENSGQRTLVSYRPWGHRVRHDWATKPSPAEHVHVCIESVNPTIFCCVVCLAGLILQLHYSAS